MTGQLSPLDRLRAAHRLPADLLTEPERDGQRHRSSVAVRKALLLALADHAAADGWCRVGVRRLTTMTGYGDRIVRDAIHALPAGGWIADHDATWRDDGSRSVGAYQVAWSRIATHADPSAPVTWPP